MKARWVIGLTITFVLAISAAAQESIGSEASEGAIVGRPPVELGGGTANPVAPSPVPGAEVQGAKTYPEQLQAVLDTMSAELAEIAQAVREGKISRSQGEYLSVERYYVALTRFQFLRTLYQGPEEAAPAESSSPANAAPQITRESASVPSLTCSPDIPNHIVGYLQLSPAQLEAIQAQIRNECEQIQPLLARLEASRRKEVSIRLSGKFDQSDAQALAAEQSGIIKQLLVANSQLETKLYSLLTSEQQRKVDGLLRQSLDSGTKIAYSEW